MGAKDFKGKTIAVLGCGFNKIYPPENEGLFNDIIEKGGCIVSEYAPDENVVLQNFPSRNRIIAGLSDSVLVVEARTKSGSTSTARHAFKQKKQVFCIPGDIDKTTSGGTNLLIQEGAYLVRNVEDILKQMNIKYKKQEIDNTIQEQQLKQSLENINGLKLNTKLKSKRAGVENGKQESNNKLNKKQEPVHEIQRRQICKEYEKIYSVLGNNPMSSNEIYLRSGEPISEVNQVLTMLELEGYIKVEAGNKYVLK